MNFYDLALKRRSVNYFKEGVSITKAELHKIIDLAQFCPSSSNLQPWKLVVVQDDKKKEALRKVAFNQPKVTEASAVFIVLGDTEGYKQSLNPTYKNWVPNGYMDEKALADYIKMIEGLYSSLQTPDHFAVRNSALFAMSLMYSAEFFGWNTHPMIGFNPADVKKEFGITDRYIPVMLIAIGKFNSQKNLLKRNARMTMDDFCSFDSFKENKNITFKNIFFEKRKALMKGKELTLTGTLPEIGKQAPSFKVHNRELKEIQIGPDFKKAAIISSVPSLDTPVCSLQTKKLNGFLTEYKDKVDFMTISCDTPFAQQRFCDIEKIETPAYSDYINNDFAINYGVLISELHLCARAVFIIDNKGVLKYSQIVGEISHEPDYDPVMDFVKQNLI